MAHLRDFRRLQFKELSKKPPLGYETFSSILANVHADAPKQGAEKSDDDDEESDSSPVRFCPVPEPEISVVDLTGDTATTSGCSTFDANLADLEKGLFKGAATAKKEQGATSLKDFAARPVHHRLRTKTTVGPKPPSADIADLLQLAEKTRAPTPDEVRARTKAKAKDKALRTPKKGKGKAKVKVKKAKGKGKGTGKREHEKVHVADLPVEWQSVVDKCSPKNNPDVDFSVLLKRAHSKIYHSQKDTFSHTVPLQEAKRLASEAAVRVTCAMRAQFA
eukprot:9483739-Pyramimonas_sp.AAC.1